MMNSRHNFTPTVTEWLAVLDGVFIPVLDVELELDIDSHRVNGIGTSKIPVSAVTKEQLYGTITTCTYPDVKSRDYNLQLYGPNIVYRIRNMSMSVNVNTSIRNKKAYSLEFASGHWSKETR